MRGEGADATSARERDGIRERTEALKGVAAIKRAIYWARVFMGPK